MLVPGKGLAPHGTVLLATHTHTHTRPLFEPDRLNLKLTFSLIFGLKNLLRFSFLFCQFILKLVLQILQLQPMLCQQFSA